MSLFNILALLITLAAVFSYINHRYIRFPTTIGLMVIALSISLALILMGKLGFAVQAQAEALLGSIDFNKTLISPFDPMSNDSAINNYMTDFSTARYP